MYVRVDDNGVDVEVGRGILPVERVSIVMNARGKSYLHLMIPLEHCDVEGKLSGIEKPRRG
ncbi:MAG: hypothetical protein QXZ09_08940 [Candidatus Methanomethylicaceae archaeon]